MKIYRLLIAWLILLTLAIEPILAWARAGGSGGGHSHSHSSSHSSFTNFNYHTDTNYHIHTYTPGRSISFHTFITILLIVAGVVYILYLLKQSKSTDLDATEAPPIQAMNSSKIPLASTQLSDLKNKAKLAFLTIQKAWSLKQLPMMRRFISDGVYQRFNAQFKMMNILGQENLLSNIEIREIQFTKYSAEGKYECIDIGIRAYAEDQFTSEKLPQFNSPGGGEEFTEYWSFIRRKDYIPGHDIFNSENCPQCAAPLNEKLLETARCSYCGAYLNNGEYDWVLCEITQAEDYKPSDFSTDTEAALQGQIDLVVQAYPPFARHLVEDSSSNAFLQILIARTTGEADVLRRFCTNDAFEKVKNYVKAKTLVYDRLYLSSVELASLTIKDNRIRAQVVIEYCSRMVVLKDDGKAQLYTNDIVNQTATIVLMREISKDVSKGTIFANACSTCGATQTDHLSAVCAYCGSPLNDPKRDWVVDDFSCEETSTSRA
jgi:predicted lipid-binding transport protein (Tim44 family)